MSREIRVAIVGMILGILATIATEEMKCILLPFTSNCLKCWKEIQPTINVGSIWGKFSILLLWFVLPATSFLMFVVIDPKEQVYPNRVAIVSVLVFLILPLTLFIVYIYNFEKCL